MDYIFDSQINSEIVTIIIVSTMVWWIGFYKNLKFYMIISKRSDETVTNFFVFSIFSHRLHLVTQFFQLS